MSYLVREFSLAGPDGDGLRPYLNKDGAFIGPVVPLLEKDAVGRWRPRRLHVLERLLWAASDRFIDLSFQERGLQAVCNALNKGEMGLAAIALVHAELPALADWRAAVRIAKADGLIEKYDPDEPRDDHGRWTSGGDDGVLVDADRAPGFRTSPKDAEAQVRDPAIRLVSANNNGGSDEPSVPMSPAAREAAGLEPDDDAGMNAPGVAGLEARNSAFESLHAELEGTVKLPKDNSQLMHIFAEDEGHLPNTQANRDLLVGVANNTENYLGTDKFGNVWSGKTLPDGSQLWVQVRDGTLQNGGINKVPKTFDPNAGLSSPVRPSQKWW